MSQRLLHIFLLILLVSPISAQLIYSPFKMEVGLLVGEENEHKVGILAPYIEPKYELNEYFSLGLRLECVFYRKEDFIEYNPNNPYLSDLDSDGLTLSALTTVDYYFNDHFIRPFIGIGAGVYYMENNKENSYLAFDEQVLSFGYCPRVGVAVGGFRLSCEYNFILTDKTELDYLSLKVGYEIGGGRNWF